MKILFKIMTITVRTVLFLLLLILAFIFFNSFMPNKILQAFTVTSGSMEPSIKTGSMIFTLKTDNAQLKKGDVIAFTSAGDDKVTVTHRIIEVWKEDGSFSYRTKGDMNDGADIDKVAANQIKGKVLFSIPQLGYLSANMKNPRSLFLFIIVPALFVIGLEFINIKKAIEENVHKKYEKKMKEASDAEKLISIFLIFTMTLFSLLRNTPATLAYFSDGLAITGNVFSTGYWLQTVVIDIKPDEFPNPINPGAKGVVPVALIANGTIDIYDIDIPTVRFAGAQVVKHHFEDVYDDGETDIVFHFNNQDILLPPEEVWCSDVLLTLEGVTLGGVEFEGSDYVKIVPPADRGKPGSSICDEVINLESEYAEADEFYFVDFNVSDPLQNNDEGADNTKQPVNKNDEDYIVKDDENDNEDNEDEDEEEPADDETGVDPADIADEQPEEAQEEYDYFSTFPQETAEILVNFNR
jgi:signal peptidase I